MKFGDLNVDSIESQLFAENTYIVSRDGQADCVVVDPGFQHPELVDFLKKQQLRPLAILNTHGHSDHIAGNQAMKEHWPESPLLIGKGDAYKLTDPDANLSAPFGKPLLSPPADDTLSHGQKIEVAGIPLEVLDTPGHSKGHIVFVYPGTQANSAGSTDAENGPAVIFGGDVLFRFGIGRTDFFDGSFEDLKASIQQKLFEFPRDTIVLPGHGPPTTIGDEIDKNPFVGKPTGYVPPA